MPDQFGGMAPAMPGQVDKGGKDMRGKLQMGIILSLLEIALPNLSDPEDKIVAEEAHLKLLKRFSKPPGDMAKSEMNFMQSQLAPLPRGSAMDSRPGIQGAMAGMGVQPPAQAGPVAA